MNKMMKLGAITLVSLLLASCGGGGGGGVSTTPSTTTSTDLPFPLDIVVDSARFLLFPNPQRQAVDTSLAGTDETNTVAYTNAYYAAIDPANERTTLTGFKQKNGFNAANGIDKLVVFGDQHDLGYGRRMYARKNNDGSIAFYVDNYVADLSGSDYGTYNHLNVEAAVLQDDTGHKHFAGTSAIEFSPAPNGTVNIVKFYNFDENGNRRTLVNQDGLGYKAMPGICVSCHGGRADPLTPSGLFALVGNSKSQARGDTESHLQLLKLHTFDFSTNAQFNRASQENDMRTINQWIHDSYNNTGANEWNGSVAQDFIETAYGNSGNGTLAGSYSDTAASNFLPDASWQNQGQDTVYKNVLSPACMTCHILRGTKNLSQGDLSPVSSSDVSFTRADQFLGYKDRIQAHVFNRGNMPLAKIVFDRFWATGSTLPNTLALSLSLATGVQPGRPIADPGPDRVVKPSTAIPLAANNSLYSSSYAWSIVTNPGGASLSSTTGVSSSLNATVDGTYVVRLTATGNGLTGSTDVTIKVDSALSYDPTLLRFSDVKTIIQSAPAGCTAACHSPLGNVADYATTSARPPIFYTNIDRNGDNVAGDSIDDDWFYKELRGRVNFTDVVASPLLRKPSGYHHNGGVRTGFGDANTQTSADQLPVGDSRRASYDMILNWILQGAPR